MRKKTPQQLSIVIIFISIIENQINLINTILGITQTGNGL